MHKSYFCAVIFVLTQSLRNHLMSSEFSAGALRIQFGLGDLVCNNLYMCVADSLWDQLTKPFPDENFAPHKRPRSMPFAGGRSADSIGKWDLQGDQSMKVVSMSVQYAFRACRSAIVAILTISDISKTKHD